MVGCSRGLMASLEAVLKHGKGKYLSWSMSMFTIPSCVQQEGSVLPTELVT